MAAAAFDVNDLKRRMQGAIASLKQELSGLRTGRASTALLDHVQVEAYGNNMPLNQLASISVPEPRLRIPELNEERRREIVKLAHKYAEGARVAVRHVRRDGLDLLKKLEKDHKISEDDETRQAGEVQKATDATIAEVEKMLAGKEKEIMTV